MHGPASRKSSKRARFWSRSARCWASRAAIVPLATAIASCGALGAATKSGIKPILTNGIQSFVEEPDIRLAEQALAANLKLIEGVLRTYPDDRELLLLAAMARANYAFGFLFDDLEACRIARPDDRVQQDRLLQQLRMSYGLGRDYAERALAMNEAFAERLAGRRIDAVSPAELQPALATLNPTDATALFWLAFTWGGALQAGLDAGEATQLPKLVAMVERVVALDDRVFYGVGPHLMAGVLKGFRSPALGGQPEAAAQHFDEAKRRSQLLLPDVLKAQWVFAQTERVDAFRSTLASVIEAEPRADRALLEALAKKKACRLLANVDAYFLEDAQPVPPSCRIIPHKYRLRAEPLAPPEAVDP